MSDKPIPYSAPMIRALLAGTKTQTRRVLKLPTKTTSGGPIYERKDMGGWEPMTIGGSGCTLRDGTPAAEKVGIWHQTTGVCMTMPIQPGDRLWVREAWHAARSLDRTPPREIPRTADIEFAATKRSYAEIGLVGKLRPGMFMPRWASRFTQIVTDVRVQRLHDISEEDALAEGIERQDPTAEDFEWAKTYAEEEGITEADLDMGPVWIAPGTRQGFGPRRDSPKWGSTPVFAYRLLWESINGPGSWDANPWIAAYTVETHHCNIDEMPAQELAA